MNSYPLGAERMIRLRSRPVDVCCGVCCCLCILYGELQPPNVESELWPLPPPVLLPFVFVTLWLVCDAPALKFTGDDVDVEGES